MLFRSPILAAGWWIVGGASAGLLLWCWPPARLFMGDVGSGFLGFVIMALLVWSLNAGVMNVPTALVLVAPFACDATITLCRRMLRGEPWYAGHRLHGYQHLARRWGSHRRVTVAAMTVNILVVAPAAAACAAHPESEIGRAHV